MLADDGGRAGLTASGYCDRHEGRVMCRVSPSFHGVLSLSEPGRRVAIRYTGSHTDRFLTPTPCHTTKHTFEVATTLGVIQFVIVL